MEYRGACPAMSRRLPASGVASRNLIALLARNPIHRYGVIRHDLDDLSTRKWSNRPD